MKCLGLRMNGKVKSSTLLSLSTIMFFAGRAIQAVCSRILGIVGLGGAEWVAALIVYAPLIFYVLYNRKLGRTHSFFVVFFAVVLSFLWSMLLYPENRYWILSQEFSYNALTYVFLPLNGLYACLFMQLERDEKKLTKDIEIAQVIMFAYCLFRFIMFRRVGYWDTTNSQGEVVERSYNLNFGYDVIFCMLIFLNAFFARKNKAMLIMSIICAIMILMGGSRGPFLLLIVYVALTAPMYAAEHKKNARFYVGVTACLLALILIVVFYDVILLFLEGLLSQMGIQSRTLQMLLTGQATSDNGREPIYAEVGSMLGDLRHSILGYGVYGDRARINPIIYAGYCHNIFLEILVDYGWVLGGLLCIGVVVAPIFAFIANKGKAYRGLLIVFVSLCVELMISSSFWGHLGFWALIGLMLRNRKRRRSKLPKQI